MAVAATITAAAAILTSTTTLVKAVQSVVELVQSNTADENGEITTTVDPAAVAEYLSALSSCQTALAELQEKAEASINANASEESADTEVE